jgi:hypothetical protein
MLQPLALSTTLHGFVREAASSGPAVNASRPEKAEHAVS